jgi:hypothetical protein
LESSSSTGDVRVSVVASAAAADAVAATVAADGILPENAFQARLVHLLQVPSHSYVCVCTCIHAYGGATQTDAALVNTLYLQYIREANRRLSGAR